MIVHKSNKLLFRDLESEQREGNVLKVAMHLLLQERVNGGGEREDAMISSGRAK